MRKKRGRGILVVTGIGAAVITVALVILLLCTVAGAGAKIAGIAAVIGGMGSAYGGVAAAISAGRAREAAEASDAVTVEVAKIARDSQDALARAIKPRLELGIWADWELPRRVSVYNRAAWSAKDVEVIVELPAGHVIAQGTVDEVEASELANTGAEAATIPPIPQSIRKHAIKEEDDSVVMEHVAGKAYVRFSDAEGIRTYLNEYELYMRLGSYLEDVGAKLTRSRPAHPDQSASGTASEDSRRAASR